MTELDHILDVHRRESERAEVVAMILLSLVAAIAYAVYLLIGWAI